MRFRKFFNNSLAFDTLCRKPNTTNAHQVLVKDRCTLLVNVSRKDASILYVSLYKLAIEILVGRKVAVQLSSRSISEFQLRIRDPLSCSVHFNGLGRGLLYDNFFEYFSSNTQDFVMFCNNRVFSDIFLLDLFSALPSFFKAMFCSSRNTVPKRMLRINMKMLLPCNRKCSPALQIALSSALPIKNSGLSNLFRNYVKYVR